MVDGNKVDNQLTLGHGDHSGLSEVGRVEGNLVITLVITGPCYKGPYSGRGRYRDGERPNQSNFM